MPAPRRRIDSYDGLRAFAVLLVFAHHVDQRLLPGGFLGVDVFFVLSGYLITWLLLREREKTGTILFRRFYARRFLRLMPALFVVAIVGTGLEVAFGYRYPLIDGAAAMLYLTDFWQSLRTPLSMLAHTWSLAVEEQFYLVWPAFLVLLLARRWPVARCILILAALSTGLSLVAVQVRGATHAAHLPTTHMPEIMFGALLAVSLRDERVLLALRRLVAPMAFPVLALASIVGALFLLHDVPPVGQWVVAAVCAVPVAHLALAPESGLARCLSWRPAVWLGLRSYGFYLWHYPVLLTLRELNVSGLAAGLAGLLISLLIATVSYRYVEQPFLRRKDLMAGKWQRDEAPSLETTFPSVSC